MRLLFENEKTLQPNEIAFQSVENFVIKGESFLEVEKFGKERGFMSRKLNLKNGLKTCKFTCEISKGRDFVENEIEF